MIPQGSRNRNSFWPSNPIIGYIPKWLNHSIIKTHAHVCILQHFTVAKTWNQPKCPSMIDWAKKMWHIYTMEYYAAIKIDEFASFIGTWMNLETIILSKLTQEQKIKHCMFSLIGECWTMRTHGHREGNITHWGLWGGNRGRTTEIRSRGETAWGEMPDIGVGEEGSKSHCHVCTYATILHVLQMYPKT